MEQLPLIPNSTAERLPTKEERLNDALQRVIKAKEGPQKGHRLALNPRELSLLYSELATEDLGFQEKYRHRFPPEEIRSTRVSLDELKKYLRNHGVALPAEDMRFSVRESKSKPAAKPETTYEKRIQTITPPPQVWTGKDKAGNQGEHPFD